MVRISDARMSGTAYGTVVLHVAPEARPAARWRRSGTATGSSSTATPARCTSTSATRNCERRMAQHVPPQPPNGGGYQRLYVDHVLQADEGCDFDFLVGCRGAAVPRHSH